MAYSIGHEVDVKNFPILEGTFGFLKAHSWKHKWYSPEVYTELIFSNTLSPITRCSSASQSVSETCK